MLISNVDFAFEINLGFPNQWKYVKSMLQFREENQLRIILFFTGSLDLCLNRAKKRHENGLHLVEPEIIKTMYNQTLPLFRENINLVDTALFVDMDEDRGPRIIADYNKTPRIINMIENAPAWFLDQLYPFIKVQ